MFFLLGLYGIVFLILLSLFMLPVLAIWMYRDAKDEGRTGWARAILFFFPVGHLTYAASQFEEKPVRIASMIYIILFIGVLCLLGGFHGRISSDYQVHQIKEIRERLVDASGRTISPSLARIVESALLSFEDKMSEHESFTDPWVLLILDIYSREILGWDFLQKLRNAVFDDYEQMMADVQERSADKVLQDLADDFRGCVDVQRNMQTCMPQLNRLNAYMIEHGQV